MGPGNEVPDSIKGAAFSIVCRTIGDPNAGPVWKLGQLRQAQGDNHEFCVSQKDVSSMQLNGIWKFKGQAHTCGG